ncbi:c-type heme family protein [Leptolyngbya sp. AN02str]|uniref:c-type heme family protein n=1 Tax=Leptolyngbya sp. AN02str TaxID=3423363 RepID=UPI003D317CB7
MISQLKLGTKFTLLLLIVYFVGSAIGGLALSEVLQKRAERQIISEGTVLMQSINAVRTYTDQQVRPLLEAQLAPDQFVPEVVPAYSARRVYENLRATNSEYSHLSYKEAVLNPTNLNDLADPFEADLVNQFKGNESLSELSGFRTVPELGSVFYSAHPIVVRKSSCLKCHGVPDDAPQSMLSVYGREHGFDWPLNTPIGAQVVYVPATEVFTSARRAFSSIMGIFVGVFAIALFCLNRLLKPTVLHPVQTLARVSQQLAVGDIKTENDVHDIEIEKLTGVVKRRDELGQLGRIFQTMVNEVVAREQRMREQIRELTIEIDQTRKAKEVAEIVESDYFQDLKKKAGEIRKRKASPDTSI